MDLVIRLALQLTPCSTTCTTEDFVNVLESLSENYAQDRTDAYRNYLKYAAIVGYRVIVTKTLFIQPKPSLPRRPCGVVRVSVSPRGGVDALSSQ
ncbi:hypothetical protein EDD17DRAFT_1668371 [Pisolithus thermaeus]|nr:hypothetical protein EDD17DRAFT_1668371 [Pisolithus thermaeus]